MSGKAEISVSNKTFDAEIADTFLSKFAGFRLRSEGKMIFKFSEDSKAFIDMMLVPETLYLYFLDSDKNVIEIQKAEPWSLNPKTWKLYRPDKPYRYLLESFEKLELSKDDTLEFEI